jgi:hypothetical protein
MKLTEAQVKNLFVTCNNDAKDGIYHGEYPDALDLMEFSTKLVELVSKDIIYEAKREEHKRCVELAKKVNPFVAEYLLARKEYTE